MNKNDLGRFGESIAEKYFKQKGYYLLAKNFKWLRGEIDLVFMPGKSSNKIIFVEVKLRTDNIFGEAEEGFSYQKNMKLKISMIKFMKIIFADTQPDFQLDFLAIRFDAANRKAHVRHFKNI
ncbi:YraN family protein [Candidatus Peregrinibacteria bacterium]|nr:YraN family protein [Candidatus Peregrinibacteria bacterium]